MPTQVILDTDPGVDDAMALLLALRSPEIELIGVTTVFGNSNIDATTRNALNLLHIAGRTDIPVARGAARPLAIEPHPTAENVHGPTPWATSAGMRCSTRPPSPSPRRRRRSS